MAKIVLEDLTNLRNEASVVAAINRNNEKIEAAIENTLSRDGTTPNTMQTNLDMNSNRIINLSDPVNDNDLATKGYVDESTGNAPYYATLASTSATAAAASQVTASAAALAAQGYASIVVPGMLYSDIASTTISATVKAFTVVGYASQTDGGYTQVIRSASSTPSAWNVQSADGAYWQIFPVNGILNVRSFGAKGDGSTDDFTAFDNALAAAKALGAHKVYGSYGDYVCNTRLDVSSYSGLTLELHPLAILNFSSSSAPWENSTYNGLIYGAGTKSSSYSITANTYKTAYRIKVTSITVAAGTATVTTPTNHGFSTGEYIHVYGQYSGTPSNEQGLYSTPWEPYGIINDCPFVITVTSATTFTYTTTATANLTSSAYVMRATNVVKLNTGLGSNFSIHDVVLIDNGVSLTGGSSTVHDGEQTRVKGTYGDLLVLSHSLNVDVDTANSPVAYKVTPITFNVIGNFLLKGRGYNSTAASVYGQVGVRLSYAQDSTVKIRILNVDQTGVEFRSCLDCVMSVTGVFDPRDEGGRLTGYEKIQYGGSFANACRNCVAENMHIWGSRHGFIISHTSSEPGRSWACVVRDSEFGGTWYAALCTQNTNGSLTVTNVSFSGRGEAINHRAGSIFVNNCQSYNCRSFLTVWRRPEVIVLNNNYIKGCLEAAYQFSDDFISGYWPHFEIDGDTVDGGEYALYMIPLTTLGSTPRKVFLRNMVIKNIRSHGIYLRGGAYTCEGTITDCSFEDIGLSSTAFAIRIENGVNMKLFNTELTIGSGSCSRIIYLEGSSTAGIIEKGTRCVDSYPSEELVTVAAGTAARVESMETQPQIKTGDFTVDHFNYFVNNKSGSACVVTLPTASSFKGRVINLVNWQAQAINSASSNVVPIAGGAAGTAIVTGTAGKFARITSTNVSGTWYWVITESN